MIIKPSMSKEKNLDMKMEVQADVQFIIWNEDTNAMFNLQPCELCILYLKEASLPKCLLSQRRFNSWVNQT